jgi:hypothetical protein
MRIRNPNGQGRDPIKRRASRNAYHARHKDRINAWHRAYAKAPEMRLRDAHILKALLDQGGYGNRFQIAAWCVKDPPLGTVDVHLARMARFGLIRRPYRGLWAITERGRIAWAIWQAKRLLTNTVDEGRGVRAEIVTPGSLGAIRGSVSVVDNATNMPKPRATP